jgi:hypothetical protein
MADGASFQGKINKYSKEEDEENTLREIKKRHKNKLKQQIYSREPKRLDAYTLHTNRLPCTKMYSIK